MKIYISPIRFPKPFIIEAIIIPATKSIIFKSFLIENKIASTKEIPQAINDKHCRVILIIDSVYISIQKKFKNYFNYFQNFLQ
jgi:hypothetical protein